MDLARFPRVKLCTAPTALELLPRLTAALGGPEIWMKRDDLTGMGLGGNKVRKLEFLAGESGLAANEAAESVASSKAEEEALLEKVLLPYPSLPFPPPMHTPTGKRYTEKAFLFRKPFKSLQSLQSSFECLLCDKQH